MEKDLIDSIYFKLASTKLSELPLYLKGGQIGVAIFMALYSRWKEEGCDQAWKLSSEMLIKPIQSISKNGLSYRLLDGNLGIALGISYLVLHGFIEEDEKVRRIYQHISNIVEYHGTQNPLYIIEGEQLFSAGIYLSQLFTKEETLIRYFQEERLIELVDECEKLITYDIEDIYNPHNMPLSMLNSILIFLQRMKNEKIFPFLVQQLLTIIPELYLKIKKDSIRDEYIYTFFTKKDHQLLIKELNIHCLVELIGDIGFYSLLYNCPKLFNSFWAQLEYTNPTFLKETGKAFIETETDTAILCGWGYGLLCNKKEKYERK